MNIQQLESMIEQVSHEEVEAEQRLARIRADRRACDDGCGLNRVRGDEEDAGGHGGEAGRDEGRGR